MLTLRATQGQLKGYVDLLNQYGLLTEAEIRRFDDPRFQRAFARTILQKAKPRLAGYEFSLVRLRTLRGKSLDFVLPKTCRLRLCKKTITVFVGHRFSPTVTHNLRHNLLALFRLYKITPQYSDTDLPNGPVFQTILKRIQESDFCVFDDKETEAHPNVFIELGAAIALGRPYVYFSYRNKRTIKLGNRRQPVRVPSDLAEVFRLEYSDYRYLFSQFAVRLPGFSVDRGLAQRPGADRPGPGSQRPKLRRRI